MIVQAVGTRVWIVQAVGTRVRTVQALAKTLQKSL